MQFATALANLTRSVTRGLASFLRSSRREVGAVAGWTSAGFSKTKPILKSFSSSSVTNLLIGDEWCPSLLSKYPILVLSNELTWKPTSTSI